jgi:acetyltransferase-like isoleucine patch superfamily enzyme
MFLTRHGDGHEPVIDPSASIDRTASIDTSGPVVIGAGVDISDDVLILTHSHAKHDRHEVSLGSLTIADGAWVGARAIILPTCHRIGVGSVIGAGAVVTRDVPDGETWAGNPAREV